MNRALYISIASIRKKGSSYVCKLRAKLAYPPREERESIMYRRVRGEKERILDFRAA